MQEYRYTNRTIFDRAMEHRYFVMFFVLLFLILSLLYISFSNKVYRSDTTIQISPKNSVLADIKIDPTKSSSYERYFQTQEEFLKSRYLISKVVTKLNSNVHIYKKDILNHYKEFKQKPSIIINNFKVKDSSFFNKFFKIVIVDDKTYKISLVSSNIINEKITKPIEAEFGKRVKSNYLDFSISKEDIGSNPRELYIQVIPKHIEVDKAINRLKLGRRGDMSSYLLISYDANSPYMAKEFLDSLIEVYSDIVNQTQTSKVDNYLSVVDNEIKKIKKNLDGTEQKLVSFSSQNNTAGLKKQTDNLVDTIYKKESEQEKLNQKYDNMRNILIKLRDGDDYDDVLTLLADVENKNLERLLLSIQEQEKGYQQFLQKYKEAHPKMVELKRDITTKKITLKKNLIVLFKSLKDKRNKLKSSLDIEKSSLVLQPKKEIGLEKLKRDRDRLEKLYLSLLDKKSKLKLSTKIDQNYVINVVDEPYLPSYHIKPKGLIILPLFLMIGSIFGIILAILKDFFQKKIVVPEDIKELTSNPLLGSVTKLDVFGKDKDVAQNLTWQIRNSLEKYKKDKECLVVAISSLVRGEGKTTFASNLAVALGDGEKRVIIISLDLRLPTIHKKFNIKNRYGLSNVMHEGMDINNIIKKVKGFNNLYILPSGSVIQNPMKIVNSDFMKVLLSELREVFDYIVIDLAPVSVAVESTYMMNQTDLNIFVLKSNSSKKEYIKEIEEIVKSNDIKDVAYVLNGLKKRYIKYFSKENEKYIKQNQLL